MSIANACMNNNNNHHWLIMLHVVDIIVLPSRKPYSKCDHCGVTVETSGVGALLLW